MLLSLENSSELDRKIKVSIPADEVDKKTLVELEKLKNKVKIDGFRVGKIPFSVIKQRFGETTRQKVISELVGPNYYEIVKSQNLRPAGMPHIDIEPSNFGEAVVYNAAFEVFPEIEVKELNGVKIEKIFSEVTDNEIDNTILKMRKQHASWVEVDRAAQDGDQLVIDFSGEIDGNFFAGGTAKDYRFELGAGNMLQDFENGLRGVKPNSEVTFVVNFPEDYSDRSVAGKRANFTVKIHKVLEAQLAELNDEFFKKFGITENGEEALRTKISKNLDGNLKNKIHMYFKKQVLDKLLEANSITVPKVMIENEARSLQNQAKQWFSYYTKTPLEKVADMPLGDFEDEAKRRVKLGLLLAEIVKKYDLKVDSGKVQKKIEFIASTYENPEQIVKWYNKDKKRLVEVESVVLEDLALEKLQEQLTIIPKNMSYNEAMDLLLQNSEQK